MRRITACILISCSFFTCRDDSTAPDTSKLQLSIEDVAVTEAWVRLHIAPEVRRENHILSLRRNDSVIAAISHPPLDTLFYSDGLQPKFTYKFQAMLDSANRRTETSEPLLVTTMDTTSHDITWQIDTLGDGASSTLRDVAIVNDTCVFAVGEIHIRDSTGNWDPNLYNVARWDGRKWSFTVGSSVGMNAVFAFSARDVWAGTTAPYHFDGSSWRGYNVTGLFNGYVTKIWGTSSNNVYMVGTNGAIMHFDGTTWTKQESGTDVNLLDVWGSPDGSVVWACGWSDFRPTVILRLSNIGQWEKAWEENNPFTQHDDTLSGAFTSVWLPNNRTLFALSWYGVYRSPMTTHGEGERIPFPSTWLGFPWRLRGNASNDIVMVGEYFMLGHFNGMTFHHYKDLSGYGRLMSIDQRDNFAVAVGYLFDPIHSRGIVFRGRR